MMGRLFEFLYASMLAGTFLCLFNWEEIFKSIQHWQTLIAGFAALFAALGTIYIAWKNHNDLIDRREISLRSKLIPVLKDLSDRNHSICMYLLGHSGCYEDNVSLGPISDYIGYAKTKKDADDYYRIVCWDQILLSRLNGFDPQKERKLLFARFFDLCVHQALIESQFEHARLNTSEHKEPSDFKMLRRAAHSMTMGKNANLHNQFQAGLKLLDKYFEKNKKDENNFSIKEITDRYK